MTRNNAPDSTANDLSAQRSFWTIALLWLLALMLLGFGGIIAQVGWRAIEQGHYVLEWKSSQGFTALPFFLRARESQGAHAFEGADAVRFGTGLMSLGVMLAIWGDLLACGVCLRSGPTRRGSKYLASLGWLSLACMLIGITCLFPPWHLRSLPCFAVVFLILAFLIALPDAVPRSWARFFFPTLIGATLVVCAIDDVAGVSMAMGIFAAVAIFFHAFALFPRLQKRL